MLSRLVSVTIIRSLATLLETVFLKKTQRTFLSWETWSTSKCHSVFSCESRLVERINSYLWHQAQNATEYNQLTFGEP